MNYCIIIPILMIMLDKQHINMYDNFVKQHSDLCKQYHTLISKKDIHGVLNLVSSNVNWFNTYTFHRANILRIIKR